MEQVLAVYERPYDERFPVVCVDESPKQLIEIQHHRLANGTRLEDSLYNRHGVGEIYRAFEPRAGQCLVGVKDEQKAIDAQIDTLIQGDSRLKELFVLMVSVPGVGTATATEILVTSNELKTINDPKKMACHAGVAPFEHRSGTSVRGKTQVSHQARKRLKSLFHLGAMSAIRMKGKLQGYYQPVRRCGKVSEGNNKMLALNAVRNKLIHRIYAFVKRCEKYDKIYLSPLA